LTSQCLLSRSLAKLQGKDANTRNCGGTMASHCIYIACAFEVATIVVQPIYLLFDLETGLVKLMVFTYLKSVPPPWFELIWHAYLDACIEKSICQIDISSILCLLSHYLFIVF
jgi:hypothetical protein